MDNERWKIYNYNSVFVFFFRKKQNYIKIKTQIIQHANRIAQTAHDLYNIYGQYYNGLWNSIDYKTDVYKRFKINGNSHPRKTPVHISVW